MNKSVVIILAGAICTALIVAFSVQAFLSPDEPQGNQPTMVMRSVLVAGETISEGERIEPSKVRWTDWPETALVQGSFIKGEDEKIEDLTIIGKPARREIQSGELIMSSALVSVDKEGGNFLAATIEDGMLAYSIPVSPSSSVGGFARPGDRVDLILTYNLRIPSAQQQRSQGFVQNYASETILRDIRVLAVDQTAIEEEREAAIGKVVTLEVTPKGAEVLALAMEMGDITLALRRLGERSAESQKRGPTTDVSISRTLQSLSARQGNEADYSSGDGMADIRVYRGGERDQVTVPWAKRGGE